MRKISQFISYTFHPVFFNFYMVCLLLYMHPYTASRMMYQARFLYLAVLFINLVVLPLLLLLFLKKRGLVSSFQMPEQKQRGKVYWMLGIVFLITAFQMNSNEFSYFLVHYIASIGIGLLMLFLINLKIKVSMHAVSAAAGIALFAFMVIMEQNRGMFPYLLLIILIGGIIGSARLYLNAHKPTEIWVGYLTGFTITFITLWKITLVLSYLSKIKLLLLP